MTYRPITDVWILARPKVKYYGAYPNGFLERALPLLGVNPECDACLHLCGGRAKDYPNKRLVQKAITVDSDPATEPDVVADLSASGNWSEVPDARAVLADPPYTPEDHAKYRTDAALPSAGHLLRVGLDCVAAGDRVGVLHYLWPQPPKHARSIAAVAVLMGFNNRARVFSVFEKLGDA